MSTTGNPDNQKAVRSAEKDPPISNRHNKDTASDQPVQYNDKTATERDSGKDIKSSDLDDVIISEKETRKPPGAEGVHVDTDQSEKEQSDDFGPGTALKKTATSASDKPYSAFTPWQKRLIILASSVGSFISPLTSNIYFPALNTIASDLHVGISQINLTITTYMVCAPIFSSPCPCHIQRRTDV
jgi:hypothetical protein